MKDIILVPPHCNVPICAIVVVHLFLLPLSQTSAQSHGLTATIRVDAPQVFRSEPVFTSINCSNSSTEIIQLLKVTLFVSFNGGPFVTYRHPGGSNELFDFFDLRPSKSFNQSFMVFWRGGSSGNATEEKCFVFGAVGTYQVRVQVVARKAHTTFRTDSEAAVIEVVDRPVSEQSAFRIMREPIVAEMLQTGKISERGRKRLSQLVRDYPDSVLADHARFALANYFRFRSHRSDLLIGDPRDDVWEIPEVKQWATKRCYIYYGSISPKRPSLRARARFRQAVFAADLFEKGYNSASPGIGAREFFEVEKSLNDVITSAKSLVFLEPGALVLARRLRALKISFVDDARLDQQVQVVVPIKTTVGDIINNISLQCGVPLDVSPQYRFLEVPPNREILTITLRQFMIWRSGTSGELYWKRRGDGYFLEQS